MPDKSNEDKDSMNVVAYSESDYKRDEESFTKAEREGKVDWSSFSRLMMRDLITNSEVIDTDRIGNVKLEEVRFAMDHPKKGWRVLLRASEQLMRVSPHYYRLNSLYSNLAMFCWWVDLYDVKDTANINTVKKQYANLAAKLEGMNLKHEFAKIMRKLPYQDIYCGLVVENSEDFFFQEIYFEQCELYQVQDGMYNFRMDLASIDKKHLNAYPDYVQDAYLEYIEGRQSSKWYVPPADKQICVKFNSQWSYPFPILIGLIKDILDLDVYKKLKLQSARTDNYKAIMVEVPIDKDTVDKPLLTPETLGVFAQLNRESMSDDIGLIHTLGSSGEAVSFKNSSNTRNNVSDAVDELYNSSGETRELYNGSSSGTAVTFSVENDSGFVYGVYRQLERWVNRFIKVRRYNKKNYKFFFYLLDITIFNRDNVSNRYKDAIALGATVIDKWMASLDMTPSRMLGSYITNNVIFDFHNNFMPLASSYNEPGALSEEEVGRPSAEEKGELLSEEGEKTKDGEKNSL